MVPQLARASKSNGRITRYGDEEFKITRLGVDQHGYSHVYLCSGYAPEENTQKILQGLGGIDKIIDKDSVVVIKPNSQWWHQGATNTNAIKGFIDEILTITGFRGEIILADNHHYEEDISRGWNTENRNGDFNYIELVQYYQEQGFKNISTYQWQDNGPNPKPREGNARGTGKWVSHPDDGDGYVWLKDKVYISDENRKCMMTYPIFTSKVTGIKIDLMRGVYEDGKFNRKKLKFINFSALNYHSNYCGVTASVKNLMGVVDMSCGYQGSTPEGYYNTHFIGSESALYRNGVYLRYYEGKLGLNHFFSNRLIEMGEFNFHYTGGALGYWMYHVCFPDLNIIEAEWVGWGGRINLEKRFQSRAILASKDPVALDYIAAKHVLLPATKQCTTDRYFLKINDPDNVSGPFHKFLKETFKQGIGNLDISRVKVVDLSHGR